MFCFIRVFERFVRGGGWKGKFLGDGGLVIGLGGGIGGGGDWFKFWGILGEIVLGVVIVCLDSFCFW